MCIYIDNVINTKHSEPQIASIINKEQVCMYL